MKKFAILSLIILILQPLQAQMITHGLINTAGDHYSNATATLTFSEGVVIDEFVFESPTLLKAIQSLKISRVFPNPATNIINIQTPLHSMIDLMDVSGKVIRTVQSNDEQTEMNISNFNNGLYILRVRCKKSVWVEKFIKR